jgi:hypothetical protein
MLSIPHCLDNRLTDGVVRLSALRTRRTLLSRTLLFICFWYYFQLEAEKIPGPEGSGKFKKSPHRVSNRNLPVCIIVT